MEDTEQTVSKLSASAASADSDIAQNSLGDTDIAIGGGISPTLGSEADTCAKDVEPAFAVQASDDRPIRPAQSTFEQMHSDVNVGGADSVVMAQPTIDDMEDTEQTVPKLSPLHVSADSDIAQNSLGDTDIAIGGGISSTLGSEADTCAKDVEPAFAVQASDDRPIRPAQSTFEQMHSDVGGADSVVMAQPTIDDMEQTVPKLSPSYVSAASADSDIAQNSLGDTDIAIGGGISSTLGSEADTCAKDVEPAFAVQASDDRPIRPAQSTFELMHSDVGGADSVVMAQPTIDDMEQTVPKLSPSYVSAASADSDIAQNSLGDTDIAIGGGISSTLGSEADTCAKDVEPAFAVQASDDRPIRPAQSTFELMHSDVGGADSVVMAQPTIDDMEDTEQTVSKLSASAASADSDIAQNSLGDTDIAIGGGISPTLGSEADTCAKDVEPAFAVQASDDRPIRPAQSTFEQMHSDVNVGGADSVVMAQPTIDDMEDTEQTVPKLSPLHVSADSDIAQNSLGDTDIAIGGGISSTLGSEADTCAKDVEPAFAVQASDDRPIRPAQSTFELMHSDVGGADSVVMAQPTIDDMEDTEQTVSKLSASAASADSDIAQNSLGDTDIAIGGGISSTLGSEADTCAKDVEPAFAVQASDDRPIRPAQSTFEQMHSDVGGADSVVMAQPTIDDMEQTVPKLSPSYVSAASAE
uniref:Uncharacterized protein n=1 Tax=Peronospora matthiolae TaxID=2874970 RepID=A0AAV1UJS3_9STRA